jgi:rhamnose utilization protein RhaD (predicted bifunctional aldolase and dehydrogenase)
MRTAIERFCARIARDPLLVQGAGGNVSWKDGDTLWVKASGAWLAEATQKDIFVAVDLRQLRTTTARGDFSVVPLPIGSTTLRPSIETLLHSLMPHRIVVHLHAVEVLVHLVRASFPASILERLGPRTNWIEVPYRKPGRDLADAVFEAVKGYPAADIVMMQNHGIVIGGHDVTEVEERLIQTVEKLRVGCRRPVEIARRMLQAMVAPYEPVADRDLHQLALDPVLFDRLERDWVLYPDHVVFLGAHAIRYNSANEFLAANQNESVRPDLVFLKDTGVFACPAFSEAKLAQLRCYYDVLVRQDDVERLNALSDAQIDELLNWDAEKYRMSLAR